MRYTYFVAYTAIHNDGNRAYGRCRVACSRKISDFDDVKAIERDIDEDVQLFRPDTVVLTNLKVIKRRINWWWSK